LHYQDYINIYLKIINSLVMKITDFKAVDSEGNNVKADCFGNNAAIACSNCNHPIVVIAREYQEGSSKDKARSCRECGTQHYIDLNATEITGKLQIRII
jgi:hypothetical protein